MRLTLGQVILLIAPMMVCVPASWCQSFNLSGYENLTEPGNAQLTLWVSPQEEWTNMSLRVEISGAMAGVLLYPRVEPKVDLGYFFLEEGNYTFDLYVVERPGAGLEDSGDIAAHEQISFTIPGRPEPPQAKKPILNPVNLGFMLTGLFVFGLILIITRTTRKPAAKPPR